MACNSSDTDDTYCYSFDIRGCQTDLFADDIPESDTKQERETKLALWLADQGIETTDVSLSIQFHEAVCEACYVCPNGDRYFITSTEEITSAQAVGMDLLSFESVETCL